MTGAESDKAVIAGILTEFVSSADYGNCADLLSEESLSALESRVLGSGTSPADSVKKALTCLRGDFSLDYDDLLFGGNYVARIPQAIARNHLLGRFIVLGNGLEDREERFGDPTMNSVAEDYTSLMDLVVCKIEKYSEERDYALSDADIPEVVRYLNAIQLLLKYCWDMLDMSSTLMPTLFKKRCFRMRGKLNSLLDMSMYGKDLPALSEALKDISDTVDEIINDQRLNDLQKARNDRYMQSKMRLYKYTIRVSEELNNQLEACDPYDFTHRNDLKKQLEAVQRFMHSFEKDR